MDQKKYIKISEFARISGIKRKTLIFYDDIGLLSPEAIAPNGYRLYSTHQWDTVSVIGALREIGMPLKEIKDYLDQRNPQRLVDLFTVQNEILEQKIQKFKQIQDMIQERIQVTKESFHIVPNTVSLIECKKEELFISPQFQYDDYDSYMDALLQFYAQCTEAKIAYGYSIGTIVPYENILSRQRASQLFFFCKYSKFGRSKHLVNKPAGMYVVGFGLESYDIPENTYGRIFEYIDKNNLTICGDSYEEYLLDEIAVKDPKQYLLKISIQVER